MSADEEDEVQEELAALVAEEVRSQTLSTVILAVR